MGFTLDRTVFTYDRIDTRDDRIVKYNVAGTVLHLDLSMKTLLYTTLNKRDMKTHQQKAFELL